jgi:hypothetical protein
LNFDALGNFPLLQELRLIRINKSCDLNGLKTCKSLKSLDLNFGIKINEKQFDFSLLNNCQSLETVVLHDENHYIVNAQVNEIKLLKGLKNLKKLTINDKISICHEDSIFLSE